MKEINRAVEEIRTMQRLFEAHQLELLASIENLEKALEKKMIEVNMLKEAIRGD